MESFISPWHTGTVRLQSPDRTKSAVLSEPGEIAMGAPTSGELKLSNGQSAAQCSPSMVWSDDSALLAVQQWFERRQRLLVLDTVRRRRAFAPGWFRVLELRSFRGGIVEGIDSPIHEPRAIAFDARALFSDRSA